MRPSKLILLVGAMLFAGIAPTSVPAANPLPGKPSPASPAKRKKSRRARRVRGQKAPTADRISEIQRALAREGFLKGEPTGKWDANTAAAMQRFQNAHNLKPTGKLDALTLQKLGLGSEVAGVAPPQPAVPNSPQTQRK